MNSSIEDPFVPLPPLSLDHLADFSLNTRIYERAMAEQTDSADISSGEAVRELHREDRCRKLAPHFTRQGQKRNLPKMKALAERYRSIDGPNSMLLNDLSELEAEVLKVYQVSYAHYVLALRHEHNAFPVNCCGRSSDNVVLSLFEYGYSNAVMASSKGIDHAYVILPFVVQHKGKGVIIVDPTSDQMNDYSPPSEYNGWTRTLGVVRNLVSLRIGDQWVYTAVVHNNNYWGKHKAREYDLFPRGISGLDLFKEGMQKCLPPVMTSPFGMLSYEPSRYFRDAFNNPIPPKRVRRAA